MRRLLALLVVAGAVAGLAACGSSSKQSTPPTTAAPVDMRGQTAVTIDAVNNMFSPASIVVDPGTKVTWVNKDQVAHNVQKKADALDFGAPFGIDASRFGPGQSYSFTFTKPGTYFYTCTIHTLMDGQVQVIGTSTAAPTTTAPTTTAGGSSG